VTHQDFAGKTILQKNYTTDNGGDVNNASDGNGHGSNCAGIVLGHGIDTGIAPGANLGAFKVLSNAGGGSFAAVDSALDWIIANHAAYNITVVSMSLGDGTNGTDDTPFNSDSARGRIQQLRDLRIPVVMAAGNDFYKFGSAQGMAYPAIFRESVSVGAVYDANIGGAWSYEDGAIANTTAADRITPFSQRLHESVNSATRTDIFAPGAALTSTGIDSDAAQSTMHGTSQATPVIAGVILLMQQLYQRNTGELPTVDQLEGWLRAGAVTVNDGDDEDDNVTNTGLNFLRVDVLNSLGLVANSAPLTPSLVVTTTADEDNGTSDPSYGTGTSLREAIDYANSKSGADTITFQNGLSGTITLGSELPSLDSDVTISGPGASTLAVSGNDAARVFYVTSGHSVSIGGLTITHGDDRGFFGGGVYNAGGTLSLTGVTLKDNNANCGGGIYNDGTLTLAESAVSGNVASGFTNGLGGGIYNTGTGTLIVINSTFSSNSVSGNTGYGGYGGGVINNGGAMTIAGSTFSGNSATTAGGGIYNAGSWNADNTLIALNTAPSGTDVAGSATSGGYNLIGNSTDSGGWILSDKQNLDPQLDPAGLQDNGGPTPTIALLSGSPAVDAGNTTLTTDQRGVSRPQGSADDIGAFELQISDTTAPESVTIATPANGASVSMLSSIAGSASDNDGGSGIKSVGVVLHRIVSGAAQYWNGSAWTATPSYLYPTLESPGAVDTNWSLTSNKLPADADLPAGTYYLRAWAYDQGNRSVYSGQQYFKVAVNDSTAPVSVTITTPADGASVSVLSSISGSASDNAGGSGIKSVSVVLHRIVNGSAQYWNGSAWTSTASYLYPTLGSPNAVTTSWSLASNKLPTGANLPAGTYYLRAWAYDQGNRSVYSGQQYFKVAVNDTTAPVSVTIATPASGSSVSSLSSIAGSASDNADGSGIKSVSVVLHRIVSGSAQYWNGSAWTGTASYLYPTLSTPGAVTTNWSLASSKLPTGSNLPTGTYYLRAWAYDQGNRSVYSGQQYFKITVNDMTAPASVTITTPANGATVSSLSAISGSASDDAGGSGIKSVSVVLHRIVSGSTQYWNGSTWTATASYLYPALSSPNAVDTDWSLAVDKLPSGTNLPAGMYYLRAWAYDQGNRSVYSGLQSFSVGAGAQSSSVSSAKLQDVSGVVSSSRIVLVFDGGLQPETANDALNYAVTVGGVRMPVLSASYASSTHRVTLRLKDGALRGGEIVVGYRDLQDAKGNVLEQAAYAVDAE
jgi:CSLREA domain-containing protein